MDKLEKYRMIFLLNIIILGFVLRIFAARSVPVNWDEISDFEGAKEISFNLENPKLPFIDKRPEGILSGMYLVKLGWCIFGESVLGARLLYVIIGIVTIIFVYFFVRRFMGTKIALISSFLLSISQFAIGNTRNADLNSALMFFSILSVFLFYEAVSSCNKKLMLFEGLIIGIGFWIKETIVLLIPTFLIFLLVCPTFKSWLKNKYLWISFIIAFCIMLPLIILNLFPGVNRYKFIYKETAIGLSMNSVGLYLGELILIAIKSSPKLFDYVVSSIDPEYPMENFALGILILISALKTLKNKHPFLKLLVTCFAFNVILFSFLRRKDVIDSIWSLGSIDWGILGFIPGIILTGNILSNFFQKYKYLGVIFFIAWILFVFIRSVEMVQFPLSCYYPWRDYCVREKFAEANFFLLKKNQVSYHNATDEAYLDSLVKKRKNIAVAKDILLRIYQTNSINFSHRKQAAWELAKLLFEENKFRESKQYLQYILLVEPEHKEALMLMNEIKARNILE